MRKHKKALIVALLAGLLGILYLSPIALSHCEIPCGIYDDGMRLDMIAEHITTIEKSMTQINELSAGAQGNANQLSRWVMNKEHHSDALSEIVTQYFLKQRIKPADKGSAGHEKYVQQLTLLHALMIDSMKCKQTTDLKHVADLKTHLALFRIAYLGLDSPSAAHHGHEH